MALFLFKANFAAAATRSVGGEKGMTRQEIKDIMPDISDEQISALLAKHHEEVSAKTKATEEKFSVFKEKAQAYDNEQAAKLSEQEKLQKLLDEAAAAKAENTRLLNRTKIAAKFVEAGIKEENYSSLLDGIVSEDEEKSMQFADNIIKAFSANAAIAADAARQAAMQTAPPTGGSEHSAPTLNAQEQYNKAIQGGSILDIIQASDALYDTKNTPAE